MMDQEAESAAKLVTKAKRLKRTMVSSDSENSMNNGAKQTICCAGCHQVIRERYMLKAVDQMWHEDCLKCSCCDCRLGEVGSTLFYKLNMILCKKDYLRLFGMTGHCSACNKVIPAFEMVMRAKTNVYHLECFACQQCNHRFCVGDKFYLADNKILCGYDYEERMVFAKMTYDYNNIAHIKRQTENLTPGNLANANQQLSHPSVSNHNQVILQTSQSQPPQQSQSEESSEYGSPDSGYSGK